MSGVGGDARRQVLEVAAGDVVDHPLRREDRGVDRVGAARPVGQHLLVEVGEGHRDHVDLGAGQRLELGGAALQRLLDGAGLGDDVDRHPLERLVLRERRAPPAGPAPRRTSATSAVSWSSPPLSAIRRSRTRAAGSASGDRWPDYRGGDPSKGDSPRPGQPCPAAAAMRGDRVEVRAGGGDRDVEDLGDHPGPAVDEVGPAVVRPRGRGCRLGAGLGEEDEVAAVVELPGDGALRGRRAASVSGEPGASLPRPVALTTRLPGARAASRRSLSAGGLGEHVVDGDAAGFGAVDARGCARAGRARCR